MPKATRYCLTDDDIRYEVRVMLRWCRIYGMNDGDWVRLSAERFRKRHPLIDVEPPKRTAA